MMTLQKFKLYVKSVFYTHFLKNYIRLFGSPDNRKLKYRISLCLIFKNEANFLKEWIDYHLTIGVDHFYLYNNNSSDNYFEVLEEYIGNGIVTLIDFPGNQVQMKAYEHCFKTFKTESNWIGFMDADEFICPKVETDLNKWLAKFSKYPSVLIYFLVFGSGGRMKHNYSKNVIEQYDKCWEDIHNYGKCFVNTRFDISNYDTAFLHHSTSTYFKLFGCELSLPPINQFGDICPCTYIKGGIKNKRSKADIHLNHYFSKSWDIYEKKMKDSDVYFKNSPRNYDYYFYHEQQCVSSDSTIFRFLIRMKLLQKGILNQK